MGAGLAAATRALYGRTLAWRGAAPPPFTLGFGEVQASSVALQFRVRCNGHACEVQVVDTAAVAGLDLSWATGLPPGLRRAAFVQATLTLWDSLSCELGHTIELIDLDGPVPAWTPDEALGARLTPRAAGEGAPAGAAILLRPSPDTGWPALAQALASRLQPGPEPAGLHVEVSVQCEPVPLTVAELAALAPGDVLMLDTPLGRGAGAAVRLAIGGEVLADLRALQQGRRVRLTQVGGRAIDPTPVSRRPAMTSTTTAPPAADTARAAGHAGTLTPERRDSEQGLDAVRLDVHVELGRFSLPLSSLRTLAVGQVFDTLQAADGNNLVLWCGGQRLGLGQMVVVGDRVGVRVAVLAPSMQAPPEPAAAHPATPSVA